MVTFEGGIIQSNTFHSPPLRGAGGGSLTTMKESRKKFIETVLRFIVTVITALLTCMGAHAAGI